MRMIYRSSCSVIYWLALTLWVSVLVAGAVAATGVFSKLLHTDLVLADYQAFDHTQHGRLIAGMIMEPIFTFIDVAQIVVAALTLLMLILQLTVVGGIGGGQRREWKRPSNLVRSLCIIAATLLLAFRMFTITPAMNRELRAYWRAAQVGDSARADEHRQAFERNHPRVSKMYSITLGLLLISVAASAIALGPRQSPHETESAPETPEKPRLWNQQR